MDLRILKKWDNMTDTKKVPVFDSFGKHVIITNPFTNEAVPQYQEVPVEVGDVIYRTDGSAYVKNGTCVEVNPDGTVRFPLPNLVVDEMETISGRRYYIKLRKKYENIEDWNKFLKEGEEKLLDDIANHMLLQIGNRIGDFQERKSFLDAHTQAIRVQARETVRVALWSFVDDWVSQNR